jgi:CHAT domain-containing protein
MLMRPSPLWFILLILDIWLLSANSLYAQANPSYTSQDSAYWQTLVKQIDRVITSGPADSVHFYYEKKAVFHRQKDDLTSWLDTYWDWQYYFDAPERSLEVIEEGLSGIWRPLKTYSEWESLLWIYSSKGYVHFELGQVATSISALEEADRIFYAQDIEGFNIVEYVYQLLGTCVTMIGDNEKARYIYEKALRHTSDRGIRGGLYNNIGLTYWNEGNNEQAMAEFQKGLSIDSLPLSRKGQLLSNLAQSMEVLGQKEDAFANARLAVSILMGIEEPDHSDFYSWVSGAYFILGNILLERSASDDAQRAFEQALEYARSVYSSKYHRTFAKIFVALGKLSFQKGNFREAIQHYHEALNRVMPSFMPKNIVDEPSQTSFYEENTIYEALEGKADALRALFEREPRLEYLEASLASHDLAYQAENLLRQVLENESAKLSLQAYRRSRTENALEVAYQLYQQTGEKTYLERTFLIAERSKASLLLDNIRENLAKAAFQQEDSLFVRERALLRYYSFYEKEYQLATEEEAKKRFLFEKNTVGDQLEDLREEIQEKYPSIRAVAQQEISFDQVQQWMDASNSDQLVEYFVGEERIYIFSIKKGAVVDLRVLEQTVELQAMAQTFIQRFNARERISNERVEYLREAYELYRLLLGDQEPVMGASVTIIPDGWLNFLPFSALLSAPHEGNWLNAPFLLKKWTIGYGYSLATLFYLKNLPTDTPKNLLAVAPGFAERPRNLPPLAFSREELKAIRIPVKKTLVDQQARLAAFRRESSDYRILHLSTHAQGTEQEVPPHIEFIDSTLYLPEIYALRLRADLVTLSACETGLGRLAEGEGVMSLSRGFTFAGAASLIASLWTVNEASTAQLFARFYEDIAQGQPKMEALRQTKLSYLEDPGIPSFQKSPYYWAGFVYYGNEGVVELEKGGGVPWKMILLFGCVLGGLIAWLFFRRRYP